MKTIITLFAGLIISFSVSAQAIKYHDINPDTTMSNWEVFGVGGIDIWWHPTPEVVVNLFGTAQILCDADTMPLALNMNDDISATSSGSWLQPKYHCLNCGGVLGNWKGATNKYMAYREQDGANWKYGWIRLTIPASANSFTIKDYAIHNTAGTAIKAGQAFGTGINDKQVNTNIKPVVNAKTVSFSGLQQQADVSVLDMSGKLLVKKQVNVNGSMDMSSYPTGVYLFHILSSNTNAVYKLAIE